MDEVRCEPNSTTTSLPHLPMYYQMIFTMILWWIYTSISKVYLGNIKSKVFLYSW
jgi:hypothetical protein